MYRVPSDSRGARAALVLFSRAANVTFSTQLEQAELPPLHLCEHLLVLNKPAGLPSDQTLDPRRDTLFGRVLAAWRAAGAPGDSPALMHRLDRDTTGCVLFALNKPARTAVTEALRGRSLDKRYLAVVHNASALDAASASAPLVVTAKLGVERVGKVDRHVVVARGGQHSESRVVVHQRFGAAGARPTDAPECRALVEVQLVTGRRHQIRVHLAHLGCPIVGDPLYGAACAPTKDTGGRAACEPILLHAWMLGLPSDVVGGPLHVVAPLPPTFGRGGARTPAASGF